MSLKKTDLGRSLYKSRFGKSTKIIDNGRRKPMKSVLEETDVQKIFSLGELCDKDYTAIRVINDKDREGILTKLEERLFEEAKKEYSKHLSVPRRPKGARFMTKEELLASEKENFFKWRHQLAKIENDKRVKLTPYELNLDFWRELWRVIETSDVLVQVVDARNPLLFRNADLESYVKEVDENKINIILINKADFLTEKQRSIWAQYFDQLNLKVIFWSAKIAEEKRKTEKMSKVNEENEEQKHEDEEGEGEVESEEEYEDKEEEEKNGQCENNTDDDPEVDDQSSVNENVAEKSDSYDQESYEEMVSDSDDDLRDDCSGKISSSSQSDLSDGDNNVTRVPMKNSSRIIGIQELISLLESIQIKTPNKPGKTTVGLVGYPNVGKSSTINAIFGRKRVSVSMTPGHTKRLQTLIVTDRLIFCDCPGLVMPSVVHSKSHLMVSGILPIDNIRDYIAPINIIASQFPRSTFELLYGIQLPPVREEEDQNRAPNARELLSSYSYMHGMMTSKGNPNLDRAARIILKDYVDGRLLYRFPPPNIEPDEFESAAEISAEKRNKALPKPPNYGSKKSTSVYGVMEPVVPVHDILKGAMTSSSFAGDKYLVIRKQPIHEAMQRINQLDLASNDDAVSMVSESTNVSAAKPWRLNNKRGKREKTRRIYAHLDKHSYVYQ